MRIKYIDLLIISDSIRTYHTGGVISHKVDPSSSRDHYLAQNSKSKLMIDFKKKEKLEMTCFKNK